VGGWVVTVTNLKSRLPPACTSKTRSTPLAPLIWGRSMGWPSTILRVVTTMGALVMYCSLEPLVNMTTVQGFEPIIANSSSGPVCG